MDALNYESIKSYLINKGVRFAEKVTYNEDNSVKSVGFFGLKITKEDQFFRCNGKVIAGNIARALING